MAILFRILGRPNPQIQLGAVDCSVALIVCDLLLPDHPIVYVSDAFLDLTGYRRSEVMGRNCRFLQAPGGNVTAKTARKHVDRKTVEAMQKAVKNNTEIQTKVTNFKRNGQKFTNMLTMIPISWDGPEFRYSVGFQCEMD